MRSRFTAFVTRDEDYLLRTWDPDTRPESLELAELPIHFYRLDILKTVAGGPLDHVGRVEFEAFHKGAATGSQRENSTFRRLADGAWVYSAGEVS